MRKTATETINRLRISNQLMPRLRGLIRPDALQPYYHECDPVTRKKCYDEYKEKVSWIEKEVKKGTDESEIRRQCRDNCYKLAKELGETLY